MSPLFGDAPNRLSDESEVTLSELLRFIFGSRAILETYRITNSRPGYAVLIAQLRHPADEVVIKLAEENAPVTTPFERTAALHALVSARTSLPLPGVLAVDTSCRRWPWRYMVKEYVEGLEWYSALAGMNADERRDAYSQLGEAVARLHTITFPGFGELSNQATPEAEQSYVKALAERVTRRIGDAGHARLFNDLLCERADLFADVVQASLCHEDLHGHNIIFRREGHRWRLAAILDFDSAWSGSHESDLSRLELWRGMIGAGFWEAYKATHSLSPMYPERRPIHQFLWCLEYGSTSQQHLTDTKRVCQELGISSPL